ncbi:hypothetical protein [Modestobacter sp. SSW1-42]|uniref:hypothetical protein n=1 Tax=Modestobacter sp. SSW1-42 TaxID=596372 RepID=UPI003986807E
MTAALPVTEQTVSAGLARFPVDTAQGLKPWALRSLVEQVDQELRRAEANAKRWEALAVGDEARGECSGLRLVLAMLCGATGQYEVES